MRATIREPRQKCHGVPFDRAGLIPAGREAENHAVLRRRLRSIPKDDPMEFPPSRIEAPGRCNGLGLLLCALTNYNPTMKIQDRIPPKMLEDYMAYLVTSVEVAKAIGCHPQSVRRAITRDPAMQATEARIKAEKAKLRKTRQKFRDTLAHLPLAEIQKRANVSYRTAQRIKVRNVNV